MTYDNSPRSGAPLQRDRRRVSDADNRTGLARWWMLIVGVALLGVGLLGFIDNPIVGENGIFMTGTVHNIVHLITGALALGIGAAFRGADLGRGAIAFGVLYAAVLVITIVSPDMFGILEMPVNEADHVLHAVLAVGSIATGWVALSRPVAAV